MKIWIALAETDNGNEMSYNWQDAYEQLTADPSYMDWLHMDDLDISRPQGELATGPLNLFDN